jgi:flavin reductase (DIM6/NTAB) family NADH-FMN oxidoreductase RutF
LSRRWWVRDQQPELLVRYPEGKQGVRDQYPDGSTGEMVVGIGNSSGRGVDKFRKFNLTPMSASCVQAPLIDECYANLECKVADSKMVAKYNFFILEVLKAWIDPMQKHPQTIHHQGRGVFAVDGETIRLPSKMK